ncbi:MAG: hypothetical protein RBQ97_04945, partial [Acholeplasma sp.]|nr:hypothetical protein [Acholeplasma sp.]
PQVINNKVIHYETDYENIVYNDGLYIINIFSRIFKSVILQEKRIRKSKDFIKLVDMINNNFNTYHNIEHIKDLIINAYFKIDIYRKFYKRILTKVNPKIIIEVISYSFDSIIINELACEKNMKIVEVQHGTILSHHIGYQYDFKHYDFHPTHILLFGDYWKKNIKISQNYTKLISVGFPYLEKRRLEITSNYTKNNTILFISQLEVGKAFYDFAILLLQSEISKKINIIFKLHNEEFSCWKNIYPKLVSSQILVIDNNDSDIYNYLSIAKTIIVGKSTVLYEALMYDADILSYNITFDPDLDYIEKNNITKSVKTFEDIYSQIYYNLDNRNKNERCIDKSIFWEINSRNKQLDIINEIIGE